MSAFGRSLTELHQRSRLYLRRVHCEKVPADQRDESCASSAPTMYGRLCGVVRGSVEYCVECTKLLLPVGRARRAVSLPCRCGNMASVLEVSPGGRRFFNVFEAAPENEVCWPSACGGEHSLSQRDGPSQQQPAKVGDLINGMLILAGYRVLFVVVVMTYNAIDEPHDACCISSPLLSALRRQLVPLTVTP